MKNLKPKTYKNLDKSMVLSPKKLMEMMRNNPIIQKLTEIENKLDLIKKILIEKDGSRH